MTDDSMKDLPLIQQLALADPEFATEMAAARLLMRVDGLLQELVTDSGLTPQEAADKLDIPLARFMEIMESEGNIKISTLARFLRGFGYIAKIELYKETVDEHGNFNRVPTNR